MTGKSNIEKSNKIGWSNIVGSIDKIINSLDVDGLVVPLGCNERNDIMYSVLHGYSAKPNLCVFGRNGKTNYVNFLVASMLRFYDDDLKIIWFDCAGKNLPKWYDPFGRCIIDNNLIYSFGYNEDINKDSLLSALDYVSDNIIDNIEMSRRKYVVIIDNITEFLTEDTFDFLKELIDMVNSVDSSVILAGDADPNDDMIKLTSEWSCRCLFKCKPSTYIKVLNGFDEPISNYESGTMYYTKYGFNKFESVKTPVMSNRDIKSRCWEAVKDDDSCLTGVVTYEDLALCSAKSLMKNYAADKKNIFSIMADNSTYIIRNNEEINKPAFSFDEYMKSINMIDAAIFSGSQNIGEVLKDVTVPGTGYYYSECLEHVKLLKDRLNGLKPFILSKDKTVICDRAKDGITMVRMNNYNMEDVLSMSSKIQKEIDTYESYIRKFECTQKVSVPIMYVSVGSYVRDYSK